MTDRAQSALKATGMDESPLASLERDDALFVLTAQTLLFQDSGGTRRVTLRDLTRIHSDQEGILRVETPAGTALTASLLGFDAARVQAFFAQVRDTTARAKQQQAAASVPAASEPVGEKAVVRPQGAATATPAPTIVIGDPDEDADANTNTPAQAQAPAAAPVMPATTSATPTLTKPAAAPVPSKPQAPASQPVVISSSGFSPSSTRPASSNHVTASPAVPAVQPMTAAPPRVAAQTPVAPAPVAQTSATQISAAQTSATPTPSAPAAAPALAPASTPSPSGSAPKAIRTLPTPSASVSGLYAQADAVEALVSRLRILGVVLGVSAIALAFFLFTAGQGLSGIWTLIAGGVGGISLLTFAELARLLVGIARATGNGSSPSIGNPETSHLDISSTNN